MRRILVLSAIFLMGFIALPAWAQSNIGVVDVRYVLKNAEAAKDIEEQRQAMREKFLAEISETEQELRAEEKELLQLRQKLTQENYAQKRQEYEAKLLETRKVAQKKKRRVEEAYSAARDILRDKLYLVVQGIANEKGFELVISNQNVIAGEKSLDITQKTMAKLNEELQNIPLKTEGE